MDLSREEYSPQPDSTGNDRLWSLVIEGPDGARAVALKVGHASEPGEGTPVDAKPPNVRGEPLDVGQQVVVEGYLPPSDPRLGRILQSRPSRPGLPGHPVEHGATIATLVAATDGSAGHRVSPVPGALSLRNARPLQAALRPPGPAECEGLMPQVKAGCGKSARPV